MIKIKPIMCAPFVILAGSLSSCGYHPALPRSSTLAKQNSTLEAIEELHSDGQLDGSKDFRFVLDLSLLNLERITHTREGPWQLLQVIPDEHSGEYFFVDRLRKIENVPSNLPHGSTVLYAAGSLRVVASLTAPPAISSTTYRSYFPTGHIGFSNRELNVGYSPFFKGGGFIVARINEDQEGVERYSGFLIPDGWRGFVQPALSYLSRHSMFDRNHLSSRLEEINAMMRSENPFLAIAAIRALSDSKYLAAKLPDIFSRLSGMNSTQQAVFICYLLSATDTEAGAESLTRLKAIIAEEPDLEKLKAIVLGAAVAEQGPPTAIQRGLKIMSIIRRNRGTGLPVTETDRLVDHFIRSDDSRLNAVGP